MTSSERRRLYSLLTDKDRAAEVMAYLDDDAQRDLTVEMTQEQVADSVSYTHLTLPTTPYV